jgi:hypothetical protein
MVCRSRGRPGSLPKAVGVDLVGGLSLKAAELVAQEVDQVCTHQLPARLKNNIWEGTLWSGGTWPTEPTLCVCGRVASRGGLAIQSVGNGASGWDPLRARIA